MQKIVMMLTFLAAIVVAGCGGGGSSDSSYSGTLTRNGVTYQCTSESAMNRCSSGDCGSCTCTSGCPNPNVPVITASCSDTGGAVTATSTGCTADAGGIKTLACTSSGLRMLSGTGHTLTAVVGQGALFGAGSVTLGNKTVSCAS